MPVFPLVHGLSLLVIASSTLPFLDTVITVLSVPVIVACRTSPSTQ
jgi:hypothetical protein